MFFLLVTKHVRDRRTDRQNYDPQDRAGIAALRSRIESEIFEALLSLADSHTHLFFMMQLIPSSIKSLNSVGTGMKGNTLNNLG